jgi:hypothetical protein
MGRSFVVALLAVLGLLCAAGMGYAAYVVSRGSVAVPVTRLEQAPAQQLTPALLRAKPKARPKHKRRVTTSTRTTAPPPPPPPVTTVDDHGGHGGGGGGGGGHGGDD